MSAEIINGKAVAIALRSDITKQAEEFFKKYNRNPGLAVIKVGQNPASAIYVNNKIKACNECNIKSFSYFLPSDCKQNQIIDLIEQLNADKNTDGILLQLPLPEHINETETLSHISPLKDVDGFHAVNMGQLLLGRDGFVSCTPLGIIELIKSTNQKIEGKNAVIVGRSNIVGKPVSILLLNNNATVTICHSKTKNLKELTKTADILIAAIGKPRFISGDMIKKDAIVIDVGINRLEQGICGDVDFESAKAVAGYITPVPGGVGPMTITMLLKNCLKAAYNNV